MPATPTMPPPVTTGAPTVSGGVDPVLLARALSGPLAGALKQLGAVSQQRIEASVSHPVVRNAAGTVIQRSPEGSPPWLDEGILHGNIGFTVEQGGLGQLPSLTIYASRPPIGPGDDADAAFILEYGGMGNFGDIAERPFMRPELRRLEEGAAPFVAEKLGQSL